MKIGERARLHLMFGAMGFVATAAQIIIMRRLIVVFGGNELVTAGVFAGWLGFSGAGNIIMGRFADRIANAGRAASTTLSALAFSIPLTIAASYLIKPVLGLPAPLMVGPGTALILSALIMAPIGLLIGASFAISARLPATQGADNVPRVYLMDALGSGAGGLIVSLIAIRYLTAFQSSLVAASIMVAAVGLCFNRMRIKLAALGCLVVIAIGIFAARPMQRYLTEALWRGYHPVVQMESLTSSLMVTAGRDERTLFVDGRPSFSLPLKYTYEAISNLPLLEHGDPRDVAMIEGGLSGTLGQWREWELDSAYFLRLDPEITYLERDEMPSEIDDLPGWMHLEHTDGRRFIKRASFDGCTGRCLDVMIVNVGSPETAATDRYFTEGFFREARAALRDDGVLAIWMLEPQNAMSAETAELLGGLMATLGSVFPKVRMLPLDRFYFFAGGEGARITDNIEELTARLRDSGMDSPYLESQVLAGIYQERVESFAEAVNTAAHEATINTDERPRAYFNGMMLWERRFGSGGSAFADFAGAVRPWMGIALLALILGASIVYSKARGRRIGAIWALAAIGFASMTYQVALLVHCQMILGVMVWLLGFIITAFMVGAGLGAWAGLTLRSKLKGRDCTLAAALAVMAALTLLMFATTSLSFVASSLLMGLVCGFVYQRAAAMVFDTKGGAGATAGTTEGADHGGAVIGSLVTGLIVIPIFGLWAALIAAAVVCAAALAMVILRL